MSVPTAASLYEEFRRDWNAALSPCVACLLARCPAGEVDALHELLDAGLTELSTPPYSPVQLRRLAERRFYICLAAQIGSEEAEELADAACQDDMGRRQIIYWPGWKLEEEEEA